MSDIYDTLIQLTKGEYWSDTNNFKEEFTQRFYNAEDVLNRVDMSRCTRFYDKGSNAELLIYSDRQCGFSCCYSEYFNQKIITCIYDKNGLVYKYDIDYEKLKKEFSERYYLLRTRNTTYNGIEYLTYLADTELETENWKNEIKKLKSGEYCGVFVSLKQVSKQEYNKEKRKDD